MFLVKYESQLSVTKITQNMRIIMCIEDQFVFLHLNSKNMNWIISVLINNMLVILLSVVSVFTT